MNRSRGRIDPRGPIRPVARALWLTACVGLSVSVGAPLAGASDAPPDVEALMTMFAGAGAVRATFVSEQSIAILEAPLESAGTLYFEPPTTMVRVTHRPGAAKLVFESGRATIRDETGVRRFELGRNQIASDLVENLMIVLRGDLGALQDRFEIAYHADAAVWSLRIRPRSRRVRALVEEISFEGEGRRLTRMSTREANGDRTDLTFADVTLGAELTSEERARLFSVEPDATARIEAP